MEHTEQISVQVGIYSANGTSGVYMGTTTAEDYIRTLPGKRLTENGKEYRIMSACLRPYEHYADAGVVLATCELVPEQPPPHTAHAYVMHNCATAEQQITNLEADNLALRETLQAYQELVSRVEDSVSAESDGYLAFSFDWLRERSQLCRKTDELLNQKVEA